MRTPFVRTVACVVIAAGLSSTSLAQLQPSTAAFTGTGTARLARTPERMRVIIPIAEEAENVGDALAALTEAANGVRKDLIKLGATAAQITIGSPDIKKKSDAGENMLGMMAAMGAGGGLDPKDDGLVAVQQVVTADFDLPDGDRSALLDTAWAIQREIWEADYDFGADAGGMNMQQAILQQTMNGEAGQNPNKTGFLFLAPVTKAERAALLREAFKKARTDTEELAMAAGTQLGELRMVSRNGDPTGYAEMVQSMMQMRNAGGSESRFLQNDEIGLTAIGTSPGAVELQVTITAGFDPAQ